MADKISEESEAMKARFIDFRTRYKKLLQSELQRFESLSGEMFPELGVDDFDDLPEMTPLQNLEQKPGAKAAPKPAPKPERGTYDYGKSNNGTEMQKTNEKYQILKEAGHPAPCFHMVYFLIVIGVILLDHLVKYAVASQMVPGESIPVISEIFHITYVQNRGAAFSMMQGQWVFLILLPCAAILTALIILFWKRKNWNICMNLAIAFICGGGLGNLIDRITQGYVVDLFDFRVFPVFNIADIFICVGCGLLLLDVFITERKKRHDG